MIMSQKFRTNTCAVLNKCEILVLLKLNRNDISFIININSSRLYYFIHKIFEAAEVPSGALVISRSWFEDTLIEKISTWAEASFQSAKPLRKTQTLQLIDIEQYTSLYAELKRKYGPYFVEVSQLLSQFNPFIPVDYAISNKIHFFHLHKIF